MAESENLPGDDSGRFARTGERRKKPTWARRRVSEQNAALGPMKSPHERETAHQDQSAALESMKNQSGRAKRVLAQHKEAWVRAAPSHGSNFGIIPRLAGEKQPCKARLGQWKIPERASKPVASVCSQEKESGKTRFGPTQKAIGWDSFNRQPLWRGIIPRFAGKKQPCKVRLGQWKAAGRASKPAVRRFRRHVLGKRNIRARCVQPDTKRGRAGRKPSAVSHNLMLWQERRSDGLMPGRAYFRAMSGIRASLARGEHCRRFMRFARLTGRLQRNCALPDAPGRFPKGHALSSHCRYLASPAIICRIWRSRFW